MSRSLAMALKLAARIVTTHGDVYIPIFERVERELAHAKQCERSRQRAFKLAGESYETRVSQ